MVSWIPYTFFRIRKKHHQDNSTWVKTTRRGREKFFGIAASLSAISLTSVVPKLWEVENASASASFPILD